MLAVHPSRIAGRRRPNSWLVHALAASTSAALLTYGMHHLPPLREHAVGSLVLALAITTALTFVLTNRPALRPRVDPRVLVLSPGTRPSVSVTLGADLEFCSRLHAEMLPHGFFVALGPRFLRAYLQTFTDSPHAASFIATLEGHRVGFLVGAIEPRAHSRWVARHRGLRLAMFGAVALATRPRVGIHFLRTRVHRYAAAWRRNRAATVPADGSPGGSPAAVLSHVAVTPGARGAGAGRALVAAYEEIARSSGAEAVLLTTLKGRDGAGSFYRALGWRRIESSLAHGGMQWEQWSRTFERRGWA